MCQKMKKKGWSIGNDMKLARSAGEGIEGGGGYYSYLIYLSFFCVICDTPVETLNPRNVILHA